MTVIAFLANRPQQAGYLLSLATLAGIPHDQIMVTEDGFSVPQVIADAYKRDNGFFVLASR